MRIVAAVCLPAFHCRARRRREKAKLNNRDLWITINSTKEFNMNSFKSLLAFAALAVACALSGHKAGAQPDPGGAGGGYGGGGYGGGGFGGGGFGGGGYGGGGGGIRALMGDPTQRAQAQVDSLRDSLAVTNDAEWDVISPRLLKVVQLKSDSSMAEASRMMTPMIAGLNARVQSLGGATGGTGGIAGIVNMLGIQSDPSADALQQVLDGQGSVAQVKAALAKFRAVKQQKQAELTKAQEALKEVLSIRQEAALTLAGYLE
jgi:hypothetical protein